MKKPLLLLVFNGIALMLTAQRVDLDRFYFNATYRDLPRQALDTSYRTYHVNVEAGPLTRLAMKEDMLEQLVEIDGWRKLSQNGHVSVSTRLEDVLVEKSEVREREEILKDKKGNKIGTKMHYSMVLTYSYAARATISDYRGALLQTITLANRTGKRTYTSQEYDSKLEAEVYFRYNIIPVTSEIMRNVATGAMRDLSNRLTAAYGFTQRTVNDFMWILDSPKHPEYEGHRKAWLLVKQAMFQMNADEPVDQIREMLQPAIAYFEKVKKLYPGSDKKSRKLRYASYYNLAKIYYYLDDPDATMREATGLVLNKFDARDGRVLENVAVDLKALLQLNKLKTRHFPIDINAFAGPDVAAVSSK